ACLNAGEIQEPAVGNINQWYLIGPDFADPDPIIKPVVDRGQDHHVPATSGVVSHQFGRPGGAIDVNADVFGIDVPVPAVGCETRKRGTETVACAGIAGVVAE